MSIYKSLHTPLPDLAKSFQKIKLICDLREKANEKTIMGMAIAQAIDNKQPADEVIGWVKSQATDCPEVMEEVIGWKLTEKILAW